MKRFIKLFCQILNELVRTINALCNNIWMKYLQKDLGLLLEIYHFIMRKTSPIERAILLSILVVVEHAWQKHRVSCLSKF